MVKISFHSELLQYNNENNIKLLNYDRFLAPKLISFSNIDNKIEKADILNFFAYTNEEIGLKILTKLFLDKDQIKINYVKRSNIIQDKFNFLIDKIKIYLELNNNDIYLLKNIFQKIFNDRNKLYNLMLFFGCELKYFKKFNFKIDEKFKKEKVTIDRWFK